MCSYRYSKLKHVASYSAAKFMGSSSGLGRPCSVIGCGGQFLRPGRTPALSPLCTPVFSDSGDAAIAMHGIRLAAPVSCAQILKEWQPNRLRDLRDRLRQRPRNHTTCLPQELSIQAKCAVHTQVMNTYCPRTWVPKQPLACRTYTSSSSEGEKMRSCDMSTKEMWEKVSNGQWPVQYLHT